MSAVKKTPCGSVFVTVANNNFVTKENYLLIAKGTYISGTITDVAPAKYFWRNAKIELEAKNITTVRKQKADFPEASAGKRKNTDGTRKQSTLL